MPPPAVPTAANTRGHEVSHGGDGLGDRLPPASAPRARAAVAAALQQGRLHHAYLLAGCAATPLVPQVEALTRLVLCDSPQWDAAQGCARCPACVRVAAGTHPDCLRLQPNARGIVGVQDIRAMSQAIQMSPQQAPRRVVQIVDAQRMPPISQNALLKTLEEPPGTTVFFLAATTERLLLPTVRSRCQRLLLGPDPETALVAWRALVPEPLARVLAQLGEPTHEGGDACLADGAPASAIGTLWQQLDTLLQPAVGPAERLRLAQSLAQIEEISLPRLLEVAELRLREALVHAHGLGTAHGLCTDAPCPLTPAALVQMHGRIMALRAGLGPSTQRLLLIEALSLALAASDPQSTRAPSGAKN